MKITIELPEKTACAFVNYVYVNENGNMAMAVKSIGSEEIEKAKGGAEERKALSKLRMKDKKGI